MNGIVANPPLQPDGRVGCPTGSLSRPPLNGHIVGLLREALIMLLGSEHPVVDDAVVTVWVILIGENVPRFVTAFPG